MGGLPDGERSNEVSLVVVTQVFEDKMEADVANWFAYEGAVPV